MSRYVVSRSARRDLHSIWDYIARDNPTAADRLVDAIRQHFELLARQPGLGQACDFGDPNLRRFPVRKNYVIYYRPQSAGITIVRVLHGARDPSGLL